MKKVIKVGVVGCGYWGPNLVRNLRQSPDCHLKVLCDTSETRLAGATKCVLRFPNYVMPDARAS